MDLARAQGDLSKTAKIFESEHKKISAPEFATVAGISLSSRWNLAGEEGLLLQSFSLYSKFRERSLLWYEAFCSRVPLIKASVSSFWFHACGPLVFLCSLAFQLLILMYVYVYACDLMLLYVCVALLYTCMRAIWIWPHVWAWAWCCYFFRFYLVFLLFWHCLLISTSLPCQKWLESFIKICECFLSILWCFCDNLVLKIYLWKLV